MKTKIEQEIQSIKDKIIEDLLKGLPSGKKVVKVEIQ